MTTTTIIEHGLLPSSWDRWVALSEKALAFVKRYV
jgi:hypothetical protein